MQLDHLAVEILKKVIEEPGISLKTLCQRIDLPLRHFYYRHMRINDWLVSEGFSPLHYDSHTGMRLNNTERVFIKLSAINERNYKLNVKERCDNLFLHIACRTQPAFTQHLSKLNNVSRNTTLSDLKKLKHNILQQKLNLLVDKRQGYYIAGCDLALRLTVQKILQRILKYASPQVENRIKQIFFSHLQAVGLEARSVDKNINEGLTRAEMHIGEIFSDKDKRLLYYMIMFSLVDTLKGHVPHFTPEQSSFLREQVSCEVAASLNYTLARAMKVPEVSNNTLFFSLLFSASKKVTSPKTSIRENSHLITVVKLLVRKFQALSGIYLQDIELLESRLFSHLNPAIHRCLFGMSSENALREEIRLRYPLLFRFCRQIIATLEYEYQLSFCDDELSYIVISFAAWMDRSPKTEERHILILTEGGQSSTTLLENQLRNLTVLPVQIERMSASQLLQQGIGKHIQLIVSTVELSVPIPANVGFIKTRHILSENEKQQLHLMLEHNIEANEVYRALSSFPKVNKPLIFINFSSRQSQWHQLIRKAAQPLKDRGIIDANYVRNIVKRIESHDITYYLIPEILLLHDTPPAEAKEGALSLLKLKHPMHFDLQGITFTPKIILILVPTKNLSHIRLLEAFNVLISSDKALLRLLNANSRYELEHCLRGM